MLVENKTGSRREQEQRHFAEGSRTEDSYSGYLSRGSRREERHLPGRYREKVPRRAADLREARGAVCVVHDDDEQGDPFAALDWLDDGP